MKNLAPLLLLPALFLPPSAAMAEAPRIPASTTEIALSFSPVVKSASPAVVNIYASRVVRRRASPFASDPFFSQFFGNSIPARPRVQNSLGSGVILDPSGIVVSNHHVVANADEIRIVLSDRREFAGTVLLSDPDDDLVVIRIEGAGDLPALELADTEAVEVGDLVLAIGNPFGVGQTVSGGIVSALARSSAGISPGGGYFIQTDAPIHPGNSGGALVDMNGRLVGINTAILTRSGGSDGIGFAIPASLVGQYVSQAMAGNDTLQRPWAGIDVQVVDADLADALGFDHPRGLAITRLHPASAFADAGLQPGDVITEIGGLPVDGPQELEFRLAALGTGTQTEAAFRRRGEQRRATLLLAPPPDDPPSSPVLVEDPMPLNGITAATINPVAIDSLGLPLDAVGVVVIGASGYATRSGLRPGDLIRSINGEEITGTADLIRATGQRNNTWSVEVERDGRRALLRLRG